MYMDTHTKKSMEKSICDYLNITSDVLYGLFDYAGNEAQQDRVFDVFVSSNLPDTPIDEILFFHLSRRLNSAKENVVGNNLFDLLSNQNEMTLFLKEHDVEFSICNNHLEIIYKGKKVLLDDIYQENVSYLRWRLGYNQKRIDYCINGFMLKDLLYRNNYTRELYDVPEFIGILATFLKRRDIGTNYFDNSRYYCFEYCLPLDKVFFDGKDNLSDREKEKYLLNQILNRLYEYHTHDIRYMYDHGNPIIRLADNDTMIEKYYIAKEEITWDML